MRVCGCHGLFHLGSMALVPFKCSASASTPVHVLYPWLCLLVLAGQNLKQIHGYVYVTEHSPR